jgi:hypothetical protein
VLSGRESGKPLQVSKLGCDLRYHNESELTFFSYVDDLRREQMQERVASREAYPGFAGGWPG